MFLFFCVLSCLFSITILDLFCFASYFVAVVVVVVVVGVVVVFLLFSYFLFFEFWQPLKKHL